MAYPVGYWVEIGLALWLFPWVEQYSSAWESGIELVWVKEGCRLVERLEEAMRSSLIYWKAVFAMVEPWEALEALQQCQFDSDAQRLIGR